MDADLTGRRILVVEDSPGLAEVTREILRDFGCEVVGPTGNMGIATGHAETDRLDAAVVDVNIRGWKIFPLARILARRNIPFVLTSGYSDWELPEDLHGCARLDKPYDADRLGEVLAELLGTAPKTPSAPQPAAMTAGQGEVLGAGESTARHGDVPDSADAASLPGQPGVEGKRGADENGRPDDPEPHSALNST